MHSGGYVGRVGGLAVALGIGSAVTLGLGCGVATAKPSDSSSSSSSSSGTSSSGASSTSSGKTAASKKNKPTRARHKSKTTERTTKRTTSTSHPRKAAKDDTPGTNRIDKTLKDAVEQARDEIRGAVDKALGAVDAARPDRDETASTDTDSTDTPRSQRRAQRLFTGPGTPRSRPAVDIDVTSEVTRDVTPDVDSVPDAATTPPAPRSTVIGADTIASLPKSLLTRREAEPTTAVINAVLFSATSLPEAPTESPAAWALLAAARREFDGAVRRPANLLSSVIVSKQMESAQGPVALAPGIVVPPEISDRVTTTGGPSLLDRITVFGMEALKEVSKAIGVNITMELGGLITTPEPPWFTTIGLDVTQDTYAGGDVWVISDPNSTSEERVIAVHGSGFVFDPNIIHWMDYAQMARETGATIVVPRYPLIPDGGTAENSVPAMADFITNEVQTYGAENVSIYADSAGATLATLAVQKIVRECDSSACLADEVPSRMVLISPALDGTNLYTDPNVELTDDPVTWIPEEDREYYESWSSGPEELWNPMLGPTDGMPPTVIYVGSREQSAPGALRYAQRMLDANPDAQVDVVIGMGQIHDWAQGGPIPINSQAANYRDDIYRQLGLVDEQAETAVDL